MKPIVINQYFSYGNKVIVSYLVYYIMYVRHLTFNSANINVLTNVFLKKSRLYYLVLLQSQPSTQIRTRRVDEKLTP